MTMKYKLIAVDMDGTLLDSDKKLSRESIAAVKRYTDSGGIFIISTGRPIQGVENYYEILGIDTPVLAFNGAMIITPFERKILYEITLDEETALNAIQYGRELGTTLCIWSENRLHAFEICERVKTYAARSGVTPTIIEDAGTIAKQGISKVLWYDEESKIEKYQIGIEQHIKGTYNYFTSELYYLEFVNPEASKASGLRFLGEYYGIEQAEMIAIGDGMNDISMIEYAGLGVAMANAAEKVKAAADFITLTNDEDGVVHVIDEIALG